MAQNFDLLVKNGTCVFPWGEAKADIAISNSKIMEVGANLGTSAAEVFDASNLHVLPGLIDAHVHFRDPGDATVETMATGTKAAVLGGLTTVFDMPNTDPLIVDAKTVDWKRDFIKRVAWCDVGIYIGATRNNFDQLAQLEQDKNVCAIKVFMGGAPTEVLLIDDDAGLEQMMRSGRRRVCYHSEDQTRIVSRKELFKVGDPYSKHMEWRDSEAAFLGTRRLIEIARRTNRPAHILHTSTAEELSYVRDHRDLVTIEVLVNHLTQLGPECYERLKGFAVMNPPIRDRRHYDAAWKAMSDGTIDVVGSDHAPYSRANKEKPWPTCSSGLTGVQTIVPLMLDHVNAGRLSLSRLADVMSAGPARVYGLLAKGRLAAGYDADLTVVDMGKQRKITNDWIVTPCGWTPFDGVTVKGWPMATFVRGAAVMRDDEVLGSPRGSVAQFH